LTYLDAFGTADGHFTADNEPKAISDWRDDMDAVTVDIRAWVSVAVGYQISAKGQADLDGASAKVSQDLDKATKDADLVVNG
jgi:hypothetical protein